MASVKPRQFPFRVMFLKETSPDIDPRDVLDALGNPHDRRILALTQSEPVEAQEILENTEIAKSTLYRRLNQLQDRGLLGVQHGVLRDGHMVDRYRSTLSLLELRVREGGVEVRWEHVGAAEGPLASPTEARLSVNTSNGASSQG